MKIMSCPECGRALDLEGQAPGSTLTCTCGTVTTVPRPKLPRWPFALVAMLSLCVGGTAFIRLQKKFAIRSRQGECKANLKLWYQNQLKFMEKNKSYTTSIVLSDFSPERGNRYAYYAGSDVMTRTGSTWVMNEQTQGISPDIANYPERAVTFQQLPQQIARQLGISGQCPECNITLACLGQLDQDATLDVWTVSSAERKAPDGKIIPPGEPFNDVSDAEL